MLKKENAALKEAPVTETPKAPESVAKKEDVKGITIQHIKPVRRWTVTKDKIIKVHRGTAINNHPRFVDNIMLTPGCVVTVVPELAKQLLKSKDFQKYGLDR